MKRMISVCLLVCMTMLTLVGCGNKIPEMNETARKMVVEYAVDVAIKHNAGNSSRLMDVDTLQEALEEEAKMAAVFAKDYSTESAKEEADTSESDASKSDVEIKDNTSEENAMTALPLAEALALEDTNAVYMGYEVTESYPNDAENIYFTMDAASGNELVVLKFDVTNTSQSDKTYDILSKNVYFKIEVNGESKNALTTMLLNDLSNYKGTIAAGAKEQLVLACEVPKETAQGITDIALNMKSESGIIAIALQ